MKLYIIRHGQTEWNTKGQWQGHSDIALNETGLAQAALIARRFADKKGRIGRIYSSPLSRAFQTAEAINRGVGAAIIPRDDLKEIFLGKWEGKTVGEITAMDPVAFRQWEEEDNPALGFDVETYFLLQERAWLALNEIIAAEGTAKDLMIVSHGAWIKAVILKVLEIPLYNRMRLILDNVGLTILDYSEENGFRVLALNDTAHLPEDQKGMFPGLKGK